MYQRAIPRSERDAESRSIATLRSYPKSTVGKNNSTLRLSGESDYTNDTPGARRERIAAFQSGSSMKDANATRVESNINDRHDILPALDATFAGQHSDTVDDITKVDPIYTNDTPTARRERISEMKAASTAGAGHIAASTHPLSMSHNSMDKDNRITSLQAAETLRANISINGEGIYGEDGQVILQPGEQEWDKLDFRRASSDSSSSDEHVEDVGTGGYLFTSGSDNPAPALPARSTAVSSSSSNVSLAQPLNHAGGRRPSYNIANAVSQQRFSQNKSRASAEALSMDAMFFGTDTMEIRNWLSTPVDRAKAERCLRESGMIEGSCMSHIIDTRHALA